MNTKWWMREVKVGRTRSVVGHAVRNQQLLHPHLPLLVRHPVASQVLPRHHPQHLTTRQRTVRKVVAAFSSRTRITDEDLTNHSQLHLHLFQRSACAHQCQSLHPESVHSSASRISPQPIRKSRDDCGQTFPDEFCVSWFP